MSLKNLVLALVLLAAPLMGSSCDPVVYVEGFAILTPALTGADRARILRSQPVPPMPFNILVHWILEKDMDEYDCYEWPEGLTSWYGTVPIPWNLAGVVKTSERPATANPGDIIELYVVPELEPWYEIWQGDLQTGGWHGPLPLEFIPLEFYNDAGAGFGFHPNLTANNSTFMHTGNATTSLFLQPLAAEPLNEVTADPYSLIDDGGETQVEWSDCVVVDTTIHASEWEPYVVTVPNQAWTP